MTECIIYQPSRTQESYQVRHSELDVASFISPASSYCGGESGILFFHQAICHPRGGGDLLLPVLLISTLGEIPYAKYLHQISSVRGSHIIRNEQARSITNLLVFLSFRV